MHTCPDSLVSCIDWTRVARTRTRGRRPGRCLLSDETALSRPWHFVPPYLAAIATVGGVPIS